MVLTAIDLDGVGVLQRLGGLCCGAMYTPGSGDREAEGGSEEVGAAAGLGVASYHPGEPQVSDDPCDLQRPL